MRSIGFNFDLPPEFIPTAQSGALGAVFDGPDGARLSVGGGPINGGFRKEIRRNMSRDESEGWKITYERVTANWASYSGIRSGNIRYARAISICGNRIAVFVLDYSRTDKRAYDPIVTRMVRSLKSTSC